MIARRSSYFLHTLSAIGSQLVRLLQPNAEIKISETKVSFRGGAWVPGLSMVYEAYTKAMVDLLLVVVLDFGLIADDLHRTTATMNITERMASTDEKTKTTFFVGSDTHSSDFCSTTGFSGIYPT